MKIQPALQLKAVTMVERGVLHKIWGQAFVSGVLPIKVMVFPTGIITITAGDI